MAMVETNSGPRKMLHAHCRQATAQTERSSRPGIPVKSEPYAKLKLDFGWLNAAHPVDADDSQ
ncbi:hypothetical protein [Thiolapillus sp.]|uniref:hypothetical protein n=1 Tax=Thiolapillus sp. TaxID=2017437 RepID=UPI003AF5A7EF